MENRLYQKKRGTWLLTGAFALGILYSCNDSFLDVPPEGKAVETQFFQTPAHAVEAVNSVYGNLREWNNIAFAHMALTTVTSDDADKGSVEGDADFMNLYDQFTFTSTEGQLNGYWVGQYQGINLANRVLDNVPGISMDENLKTRMLAETKFLRAYHYFNLVRAFGGVPIVSKVPETPEELNPARASREEVYAFIEQDLNDAIAVLPVSYPASDKGRATKGAALSLLAKVNLYQSQWQEVLTLTEQVMGLGYSLTPDFYQIFRISGENNNESIFEIQAQSLPGNCDAANSQWAEVQSPRLPQIGWGFFTPSEDLVNAFEPGDERREATILFRGETTPEGDLISPDAPNPRYNQKAYVPFSVTRVCGYGKDQNIRILRYAEVLLMHAEAANELGQTGKAESSLNMVRQRAGLDPVAFTTKEDMRMRIWHERRVELALENGERFYDLVRQGRAEQVLRALGKNFTTGKNEVFPIPQTQITLSGGRLEQNPGY
ncbi:RagB/SusD family nutrient uptake outer membrane protein [Rufibacter latericius]|uniref:RagB/SusD family nutrient uptake outer membrane protein n=1 Tax=Rufibacter latericius TaxID=2487040 RepID=A0A3M9N2K3_9BACT|nr:RagB/SusD family nutrient uptake outer membrane protein [Rufibacter latericius]RNI31625.1 RagB/SusD family nutrient uptake outer membrane protein [Rufibacter latericius]